MTSMTSVPRHHALDYLEDYARRYMQLSWKAEGDGFEQFSYNMARWADFYYRAAQYVREGWALHAAKNIAYEEQQLGLHFND